MAIIVLILLITAVAAAEVLIYKYQGGKNISYTVSLNKYEVYEGETVELTEEIVNGKWLPVPWIKTEISTSKWLFFYGTSSVNRDDVRFVPSIFGLRSYQSCRRVWRVKCLKRGVYTFENISMTGTDLFGLAQFSRNTGESVKITVLPVPLSDEDAVLPNSLSGDIAVRRFICPDPFLVSGAREYTGNEPLKTISWSATARENRLMVREYDYSSSCRLLILLNTEKSEEYAGLPLLKTHLEILIKGAAMLLEQAADMGAEWALDCNDGETSIPLSGGCEHQLNTLRCLAAVEDKCGKPFLKKLKELETERYTDIAVLTAELDEQYAKELSRLNEQVRVCALSLTNRGGYSDCRCITASADLGKEPQ